MTSPEQTRIHSILKKSPLFEGGRDDFLQMLAQQAVVHSYEKGHVLFLNQDEASRFYILLSGWVKLYRETLDGVQAVVDIVPEGYLFGEASIFEGGLYPYSAELAEAAEVVSFPLSLLKQEIENNPAQALAMLSSMARYRKQQDQELEHRTLQNASQRIGCFLLRLVDQTKQGPVSIHLPYDKVLVASRLGMQPETFSRALGKLKDATGIRVKGATIEMDHVNQLSCYSCSACSSEFPCKDLTVKNA